MSIHFSFHPFATTMMMMRMAVSTKWKRRNFYSFSLCSTRHFYDVVKWRQGRIILIFFSLFSSPLATFDTFLLLLVRRHCSLLIKPRWLSERVIKTMKLEVSHIFMMFSSHFFRQFFLCFFWHFLCDFSLHFIQILFTPLS